MQAAGTSVSTYAEDVNDAVSGPDGIVEKSNEAKDNVVTMGQTMVTTFGTVIKSVKDFENDYGNIINGIIGKNNAIIESCNDMIKAWAAADAARRAESFNTYDPTIHSYKDASVDPGLYKGQNETIVGGYWTTERGGMFETREEAINANDRYNFGKSPNEPAVNVNNVW